MLRGLKNYLRALWEGLNTKMTWFDIAAVMALATFDILFGIPSLAWIPILLVAYVSGR
ncbi:MAG: hypothetical protein ACO3KY_01485 [Lysobacterales bacterium]|jgi:hypothetical protein